MTFPPLLRVSALLAALAVPTSALPASTPASVPVERLDRGAQLMHGLLLNKARSGRIDLYFLGDSIIRRWGATDYPEMLANWRRNFHGWNAADFGVGGDTTQNVIWRLENGELDGVNPKVIVLLIGTNNVGRTPAPGLADEVPKGVETILSLCRSKAPGATIVLNAIFPRNDTDEANPVIAQINRRLATLADGRGVRWVDINDRLADAQGRLHPGLTMDKLHPTAAGYQIWADALKPVLTELMGPPSATDSAPPPTGDPTTGK